MFGYGADADLAEELAEDINILDQNVLHLKDLIHKLGTKGDTPRLRHEMRAIRGETQDMALDVRDRLNEMPLSQRVQKATLVKQFADVLQQYQTIQDESIRKERVIISNMEEKMAEQDEQKATGKNRDKFQFSLEDMGVEDVDKRILTEQNAEIKSIEKDLTQISEMFKDMNQIVEEATPQLDAIEEKVGTTKVKTEEAANTLAQTMRAVILARWKQLLIASIILAVILLVLIVVVVVVVAKT
jgi:t-SNARE complex subunit (syntaxin)